MGGGENADAGAGDDEEVRGGLQLLAELVDLPAEGDAFEAGGGERLTEVCALALAALGTGEDAVMRGGFAAHGEVG